MHRYVDVENTVTSFQASPIDCVFKFYIYLFRWHITKTFTHIQERMIPVQKETTTTSTTVVTKDSNSSGASGGVTGMKTGQMQGGQQVVTVRTFLHSHLL